MRIILTAFTILLSFSIYANNNDINSVGNNETLDLAIENYDSCLNHNNQGVVESTLTNLIKFRFRYPNANMQRIYDSLENLTKYSPDKEIKNKAALVLLILNNEQLVNEIGENFYTEIEQFLDIILLSSRFENYISISLSN